MSSLRSAGTRLLDRIDDPAGPLRTVERKVRDGPLIHSYYALFACSVLLSAIGVMMVLSASAVESISAEESAYGLFMRQVVFGVLGIVVMLVLSRVPARAMRALALPGFWISVVILALVVPFGVEVNGNRNWLSIGGLSVQPSEIAKLTCVLALGVWLGRVAGRIRTPKEALWPSAMAVGIPVLFVMYGRDMGTAAIFLLIYLAAVFFAGVPMRWILIAFAGGFVVAALFIVSAPHRIGRVQSWLTGDCDPSAGCYQAMHGLSALATGGWWGVGLGQSRSKYNYVPEAHNDFIFAIIGEELGLLGTVLILGLFAVMAVAMARVLLRCTSGFERIVTGGILAWLIGQAFVNIGMVTGVLPVIGVPLPFISYGGSSLLMCLAAVGVVMSFARRPSSGMVELRPVPRRPGAPIDRSAPISGVRAYDEPRAAGRDARDRGHHDDAWHDAWHDDPRGRHDMHPYDDREPIAEVHDIRRGRVIRRQSGS
ncbi:putative lipid II flippase FtsW [Kocuria palustris]|uniref:putative lipid II flippase FtsW n=1 Tax=Kocuria palustris TaxID=71999 RepID=UPI0011A50203|nr:putative lipid II flippase FtsW [Kocuria palustris]